MHGLEFRGGHGFGDDGRVVELVHGYLFDATLRKLGDEVLDHEDHGGEGVYVFVEMGGRREADRTKVRGLAVGRNLKGADERRRNGDERRQAAGHGSDRQVNLTMLFIGLKLELFHLAVAHGTKKLLNGRKLGSTLTVAKVAFECPPICGASFEDESDILNSRSVTRAFGVENCGYAAHGAGECLRAGARTVHEVSTWQCAAVRIQCFDMRTTEHIQSNPKGQNAPYGR